MSKIGSFIDVAHGALDHSELAAHDLWPDGVLDFSSNVNPFGSLPGVRAALAALGPAPYPDSSCLQLRRELAAQHGCNMEQCSSATVATNWFTCSPVRCRALAM